MPRKVDDVALTRKIVQTLLDHGNISESKLAKQAGTTSQKKVHQIASIVETASYLLATWALSKLPAERNDLRAVKQAFMIPRVIEIPNAPDIVTVDPLPVYEARLATEREVTEGISKSRVVPATLRGRHLKVTLDKTFREKARTKGIHRSSK